MVITSNYLLKPSNNIYFCQLTTHARGLNGIITFIQSYLCVVTNNPRVALICQGQNGLGGGGGVNLEVVSHFSVTLEVLENKKETILNEFIYMILI